MILKRVKNGIRARIPVLKKWISDSTFKAVHIIKNRSDWNMVCYGSVGDTYLACGLVETLLKTHGGKTCTVYTKKAHFFIPKLFSAVTKTVIISEAQALNYKRSKFAKGDIFYAHIESEPLVNSIGVNGVTIMDCYLSLFKIPQTSQFSTPKAPTQLEISRAKSLLSSYGMKLDKTVLIFREAHSSPSLSIESTQKICAKLKEKGWNVLINSIENNPNMMAPFKSVKLPLESVRTLAFVVGWVIAARSGIAELLSDVECKLTVLYPNIIWAGGKFIDGANLKSMGLRKNALEIEISETGNFIDEVTS